jgi:hypothetical protein
LQEGAKRRHAGAGADHDHRQVTIGGCAEVFDGWTKTGTAVCARSARKVEDTPLRLP